MKTWRDIQRESFTKLSELTTYLQLSDKNLDLIDFSPRFPTLLPRRLAEKIPKNCLDHPIARQFIPLKEEKIEMCGFLGDPLCEESGVRVTDAALHKYTGRVLILTSGACAMHCRYCFRQNFTYDSKDKHFKKELAYIQNDPTIHEVILSGGDPLSLSDELLDNLLTSLDQIEHVKLIRFHSRFPIGIPERISEEFLSTLKGLSVQIVFVAHINCIEEVDSDVAAAMKKLSCLGIPVMSQSVLLKDVNDSVERLKALFLGCAMEGIIPYYLHKLDKVRGTTHFDVEIDSGHELLKEVRKSVPGYCMPTFVVEEPNKSSKTPLIKPTFTLLGK